VPNGFTAEVLEVAAFFLERVDQAESAVGGTDGDGFDEFVEGVFGNDAEQFADVLIGNVVAAISAGLFEKGESIAHAAFGHAGDDGDGAIGDGETFFPGDVFDAVGDFVKSERTKMEMLRAGTDGVFEIFRFSGGHNKDDAVGRLFERFEESVGGFTGQHVGFVEDDDFTARSGGCVANHFAEFADLVNAAIGSGVDFNDVEGRTGSDFLAGIADATGFGCGAVHAVQRFGQDTCGGGFADAASAGKNVGVGDAIVLNGVGQSVGDVFLSNKIFESLRTPLSRNDLIAHVSESRMSPRREQRQLFRKVFSCGE
jgi:hypothetical protein